MLGLKWGLTGLGLPAPWCRDCYEEWVVYGCTPTSPVCLAARNTAVRGETALQYKEPVRLPGPALGADPREKFAFGRRRVRQTRPLKRNTVPPLLPCVCGIKCKHDCRYVTPEMRMVVRAEFLKIRQDVSRTQTQSLTLTHNPYPYSTTLLTYHNLQLKTGAKYRAYVYLFNCMRRDKRVKPVVVNEMHADARGEVIYRRNVFQGCERTMEIVLLYISNDNVIDLGLGLVFLTSLITVLGPLHIKHLDY